MPISEPEVPAPTPSISDKEQAKLLDPSKVAAEATREKEVQAAAQKAIAAGKKQEAKAACKDCNTPDEHWAANMPEGYTNVELDIATDNQVNFAMDQYRAAHMF